LKIFGNIFVKTTQIFYKNKLNLNYSLFTNRKLERYVKYIPSASTQFLWTRMEM